MIFLRILFVVSMLMVSISLFAQDITDIRFEQPEKASYLVPESLLIFRVKARAGQPYSEQVIDEDIKRLMESGIIQDVTVKTERVGQNVRLIFTVIPRPIVANLRLVGMSKFDTKELGKHVKLQESAPLNDMQLNLSCEEIRLLYFDKGYVFAKVTPEVETRSDGKVNVTIHIDEGVRQRVNDVSFENATLFWQHTLKKKVANYYSPFSFFFDIGLYQPSELSTDKVRLRDMYWKEGYLDFEVTDIKVIPHSTDTSFVDINYILFEGEPYFVSGVEITGVTQFLPDDIIETFELKDSGIKYNYTTEIADLQRLLDEYYKLGFDEVDVRVERDADPETHTVKMKYHVTENGREIVRKIAITGNDVTQDHVIRRELKLQPGDPYDRLKVKTSQDRLMSLGYFDDVNMSAYKTEEPEMRDMMIRVEEKKFIEARIGGSVSDYNSLAGMITLQHKNFDVMGWPDENSRIMDPNTYFSGGGQQLTAMGLFGVVRSAASLRFVEPWFLGRPYKLSLEAYFRNRIYDDWSEQYFGFEATIGRTLSFIDDYTFLQLGYKFEQARVYDMDKKMSYDFQKEKGSYWVSSPSLLLSHNTLNSQTEPTSGHEIVGLMSVTPRALGSSADYARFELKAVQYFSFIEDIIQGHVGAKVGALPAFGSTDQTPIYERYFLGGGDTLRGFPYRGVGPVDAKNDVLGGTFMYLVTAEVSHPIWEFIRGAVFIDAGESTMGSDGLGNINVGMGYGLRIKIPGIDAPPIKLDLAYPIKNEQPGCSSKFRIHFDVGLAW